MSNLNKYEKLLYKHNRLKRHCGNQMNKIMEYKQELQEIKKEHSIMKQFIYENGLWEKFLNDDRFIEHLRSE